MFAWRWVAAFWLLPILHAEDAAAPAQAEAIQESPEPAQASVVADPVEAPAPPTESASTEASPEVSPTLETAVDSASPTAKQGAEVAWWEGDFMGMSFRRVMAMDFDKVVMCYSRVDGAACKMATGMTQAKATSEADASGVNASTLGLLPPMAWGEIRFLDSQRPTGRIEVERLGSDRFVVCFERLPATADAATPEAPVSVAHGKMVVCSLGLLEKQLDSEGEVAPAVILRPFDETLELGAGRLVAVSVLEAGRRFAVCHHVEDGENGQLAASPDALQFKAIGAGRQSTSCRWAEVHIKDDVNGGRPSFRWTDDVALTVFRQDDGPVAGN